MWFYDDAPDKGTRPADLELDDEAEAESTGFPDFLAPVWIEVILPLAIVLLGVLSMSMARVQS